MGPQQDWLDRLGELRARGLPCVLVVVTGVQGSAPCAVGARMIVAGGELVFGTIGGGNLERQAIESAAAQLEGGGASSWSQDIALAERAGQCCGGRVSLFFEAYRWSQSRVAIFGAGHVGQALAGLAPWLRAELVLIDGREEREIKPVLPRARPYELRCVGAPEAELAELPEHALVVIMTHSHALDLELVASALRRPFPYLGLIGSQRKWLRFRERLLQRGFGEAELARVRCPIGTGLLSKDPLAIALACATELAGELERLRPAGAGAAPLASPSASA